MNNSQITRYLLFLCLLAAGSLLIIGCIPDSERVDVNYRGGLAFSADTVRFDTLFTSVGSTSKRLRVFNPSPGALNISRIALGMGSSSSYTLTVNGFTGVESRDVLILGGDSLLMLVEVLIDPQDKDTPFLVKDSIVFETNGIPQDIKLIAWGQDAIFIGNEVLPCTSVWTPERPYVLYGSVLIDSLCNLRLEAGTRVYGNLNSFIFVRGSMEVAGTAENRVLFRNDRVEPRYENAPGQWGGLVFLEGSSGSIIDYAVIRNAQYGLRIGTPDSDTIPDVILRNSIIENMSRSGILNFTSDVWVENTLVNNCADFTAGNFGGGNYSYWHCTFANYGFLFLRDEPSFAATDFIRLANDSVILAPLNLTIVNSIIDGNLRDELFIDNSGGQPARVLLAHNLLKTTRNEHDVNNNLLNLNPRFIDPFRYNYRLDTLSPAVNKGLPPGTALDLDGVPRDSLPDIGAYERIE